jgi:serine/threonine-protein kinase
VADLSPGEQFAGCRIEAVAGRGGMGVVYRATELRLGRPVALKLLAGERAADPDFRERFQRESRMAAAIDHPNVIPVYGAGEEDGRLYLVMRYVAGTDLHALLRRERSLAPERAADIVAQIAAALDAAHAAGLVHRDVKPGNVLLAGDHAYLSDFGLTRQVGADSELTGTGQWVGTADYCSPEQVRGERTDARSDVYALGCVLFTALTGQTPLGRGTVPATVSAHLHDDPPRSSAFGAPRHFDRVIWRALAKDPDDRYPSAGDLGRAALAAARGEPVTESERSVARGHAAPAAAAPTGDGGPFEPQPEAAVRHGRRRTRPAVRAVAAVAALAAVGLLLGLILDGPGSAQPSGPLSRNEVRAAAEAFAAAYAAEDPGALRRLLTRDVERVLPSGVARGRDAVVRQYERQFDGRVLGYDLQGLDVAGGARGRATGDYRVTRRGRPAIEGRIVLTVVRDRGEPRIAAIAATPKR